MEENVACTWKYLLDVVLLLSVWFGTLFSGVLTNAKEYGDFAKVRCTHAQGCGVEDLLAGILVFRCYVSGCVCISAYACLKFM
jgi:hypothetical protein